MNTYVISDSIGVVLCEESAENAHLALKEARKAWPVKATTAIEKKQWERMEAAQTKWVKASRRVEA